MIAELKGFLFLSQAFRVDRNRDRNTKKSERFRCSIYSCSYDPIYIWIYKTVERVESRSVVGVSEVTERIGSDQIGTPRAPSGTHWQHRRNVARSCPDVAQSIQYIAREAGGQC